MAELVTSIRSRFLQNESFMKGVAETANNAKKNAETDLLLNLRPIGLNKMLRTTDDNAWANTQADRIDSYLDSLAIHTGLCYRGVCTNGLPDPLRQTWFVPGNHYMDNAFTTASLSKNVAWKYAGLNPLHRVVFEIMSYTGRIVPIGDEQEISFKKGTQFIVKSAEICCPTDDKLRHVFVRVKEFIQDVDDDDL